MEVSSFKSRAKRACGGVMQVIEQSNTGITQANNTAMNQEVMESASGTLITTGNSELARSEDSPLMLRCSTLAVAFSVLF